jgi:hypothetical protein
MSAIDEASRLIETRLSELDAEQKRLENALGQLVPIGQEPGLKPARGDSERQAAPKRTRSIAKPGQRKEEVVAVLKANPGIRPSAVAKQVKVTPSNALSVLKKLTEANEAVKGEDGGYSLLPFNLPSDKETKPKAPKASKKAKGKGKAKASKRASEAAMEAAEKELAAA